MPERDRGRSDTALATVFERELRDGFPFLLRDVPVATIAQRLAEAALDVLGSDALAQRCETAIYAWWMDHGEETTTASDVKVLLAEVRAALGATA